MKNAYYLAIHWHPFSIFALPCHCEIQVNLWSHGNLNCNVLKKQSKRQMHLHYDRERQDPVHEKQDLHLYSQ